MARPSGMPTRGAKCARMETDDLGQGQKFNRLIALRLLTRATVENLPFKLAIESTDGILFHDERANEWWLFHAKHSIDPSEVTWEELFPEDPSRSAGFAMVKYLKFYTTLRETFLLDDEKMRLILFTNRPLHESMRQKVKEVNVGMLRFSKGEYVALEPGQEELGRMSSMLSPAVDDVVVKAFFKDFILSSATLLAEEIQNDWNRWMKSWIRPDVFRRLTENQLRKPFNAFKKFFEQWNRQVDPESFLTLGESSKFLANVQEELNSYVKQYERQPHIGLDAAEKYYLNRWVTFDESLQSNGMINDESLVGLVCDDWSDTQCITLFAGPGMGKSTLWQHMAFYAQKIYTDVEVFLIYLNDFNDLPQAIDEDMSLEDAAQILKTVVSEKNIEPLMDVQQKVIIFMDAFDELADKNKKSVLNFIDVLSTKKRNVKILISSRDECREELEEKLQARSIYLKASHDTDRRKFLRSFWKVEDSPKFNAFCKNLLQKFERDMPRGDASFIGLPLMMKMLADLYKDSFEQYLRSTTSIESEPVLPDAAISIISLYEQFTRRSILSTRSIYKVALNNFCNALFNIDLVNQLFAMEQMDLTDLMLECHKARLQDFPRSISAGKGKSPLLQIVNGIPRFTHRSYGEFFAAKYIYEQIETIESDRLKSFLMKDTFVRRFYLKMLDVRHNLGLQGLSQDTQKYLKPFENMGYPDMLWACDNNFANLLAYLFKMKKRFGQIGIMNVAVMKNNREALTSLIKITGNIDYDAVSESALAFACRTGNLDMVKFLVESGANVNHQQGTYRSPLSKAVCAGHWEIYKYLIENFAVEEKLLFSAVELDLLGTVRYLIDKRMVDFSDKRQQSVLFLAAVKYRRAIVEELLERGVDINLRDEEGKTALHGACGYMNPHSCGDMELVEKFIQLGADVNAQDKYGNIPIFCALLSKRLDILRLLLSNGAAIDRSNELQMRSLEKNFVHLTIYVENVAKDLLREQIHLFIN